MKKLAVFVEGFTELQFVDRLISEVAGKNKIAVELKTIRGGSTITTRYKTITASTPAGAQFYILIYDCGGDALVKDRILEEHQRLTNAQYSKIIGIRDVGPTYSHAEIARFEAGLRYEIKTSLIPVEFILSIMEIEAWFLAEFNHFPKIDPSITLGAIRASLGFDPEHDDMSLRTSPADDLHACYQIAGKIYQKGQCQTTVDALDFEFIYMELRVRIAYLNRLIQCIEDFLQ